MVRESAIKSKEIKKSVQLKDVVAKFCPSSQPLLQPKIARNQLFLAKILVTCKFCQEVYEGGEGIVWGYLLHLVLLLVDS